MNSLQLLVVDCGVVWWTYRLFKGREGGIAKEGSHCNHNGYKYVKGVDGAGETAKTCNVVTLGN